MKKILIIACVALSIQSISYAQQTDGKTKSLLKAEKELTKEIKKEGASSAMANFSNSSAVIFQPNPENAKTYLTSNKNTFENLQRTPNYANIAKSGDWGLTSGTYEMKNGESPVFGDYLTIWKVDGADGVWKIEADIETERDKSSEKNKTSTILLEGKNKFTEKSTGLTNTTEAAKVVQTTELTFGAMLKTYGIAAYSEFAANDIRLLYPGNKPILGKDNVVQFLHNMVSKIEVVNQKVDISKTGDLAYTYGTAAFEYKIDLKESLNYVAVWELQEGHKWNMIQLVFIPTVK